MEWLKHSGNRDLECDGSTVLSKLVGGKNAPAVGRVFALSGGDRKKIRDCRLQPSPRDGRGSVTAQWIKQKMGQFRTRGSLPACLQFSCILHLANSAYLCVPQTDFLAFFCVCDSTCDPVNLPLSQPKQPVFILQSPRHINI